MTYLERAQDMYNQVLSGKLMDAFEKYYHQDVVMIEASGDTCKGKDANRKREKEFLESVKEWHGGGVVSITSNEEEGVSMVESWIDVTYQDGRRGKMEEIARQKWEGDQIIEERFYYNMPS